MSFSSRSWLKGFKPSGSATKVETPARGTKSVRKDDVGYYFNALMHVDTGKVKTTSQNPYRGGANGGWHQQKEQFMRGYTHGAYVRGALKSVKIYEVDNRVQQVALATAIHTYIHSLTSASTPKEAEAQSWVEWEKVKVLKEVDTAIDVAIERDTSALCLAMREATFIAHVNTLNPAEYIACASDLIEALQRGGRLADYMQVIAKNPAANPADWDVLDSRRLFEIFDLLEAKDVAKATLEVKAGANFNGAKITKANFDAFNAFLTKTPAHRVFKVVTDFRSKAIPALMMFKHRGLTALAIDEFDDFTKDVLSRGTGMFYPKGMFTGSKSVTEMLGEAKAFDGAQFQRWKDLDIGITRVADSFTVNSGTLLGMFGFAAAVTKLYTAPNFKAQDIMGVMSAGVSMVDDIAVRYASFGASKGSAFMQSSSGVAKALSGVVLKRVIFVFGVIDAARAAHNITTSTSMGETVGNALVALGAIAGVGATGVSMMVGAGLLAVPAAPLVILGVISAALTIVGSLIASTYKVPDQQKILGASALGKKNALREDAADLAANSTEVHKGYTRRANNRLKDDYDAQLARVRGLSNGMRLKIVRNFFGPTQVHYTWQSTPFRNDLTNLSEDLKSLEIKIVDADKDPSVKLSDTEIGRINTLIKNLRSDGDVSIPGGPTSVDQRTEVKAQPSYAEPFEVAMMRRLAVKSGKTIVAPNAPPPMAFLERASA